jgi:dipeptide/tripeptide permease
MILLLLAVPILLPPALAVCAVGQRSHYIGLSVGSFILGLFMGLIGREVKSEVLFGIWILVVAAFVGFLLASLFYRRRSAAD